MISISLLEQGKVRRAYEIGKDAAQLTGEVAKDVGDKSIKTGSHIYRHKEKYGYGALGAGTVLALQKGTQAIKKAFTDK